MNFTIGPMWQPDWAEVHAIYGEGLATGLAAFMLEPPSWENWNAGHLIVGRLVARAEDSKIVGWSALAPVPDT